MEWLITDNENHVHLPFRPERVESWPAMPPAENHNKREREWKERTTRKPEMKTTTNARP